MERGPIRVTENTTRRCQNCKHAKSGALLLKCAAHKCSVHGFETCDKFEKVVK